MDAILNWPTFFVSLLWFMVGWARGYIAGRNIGGAGKSNVASSCREESQRSDTVGLKSSGAQYRSTAELQPWEVTVQYEEIYWPSPLVDEDPGGHT